MWFRDGVMSKITIMLAISVAFVFGIMAWEQITLCEVASVDFPTKGEGYKSSQKTEKKYSEQTKKYKN